MSAISEKSTALNMLGQADSKSRFEIFTTNFLPHTASFLVRLFLSINNIKRTLSNKVLILLNFLTFGDNRAQYIVTI